MIDQSLSCVQLCGPMGCSPPGSSLYGISQARILKWVAIYSKGSSLPRYRTHISYVSYIGRRVLYFCATWEVRQEKNPFSQPENIATLFKCYDKCIKDHFRIWGGNHSKQHRLPITQNLRGQGFVLAIILFQKMISFSSHESSLLPA